MQYSIFPEHINTVLPRLDFQCRKILHTLIKCVHRHLVILTTDHDILQQSPDRLSE